MRSPLLLRSAWIFIAVVAVIGISLANHPTRSEYPTAAASTLISAAGTEAVDGIAPVIQMQATGRDYHWDFIDVDITVQGDGSLRVVETQQFAFTRGTFRGAYRWIPLDRVDAIRDVSVAEDGRFYPRGEHEQTGTFTTWIEDNNLVIDWSFPPTSQRSRTFTISYTADGAIRLGEVQDEVYWKAIFQDREKRVQSSTVTVHLPPGISPDTIQATSHGLPAAARVMDGSTVAFWANDLPPYTELEIRVAFPAGLTTAQMPQWQSDQIWLEDYNERWRPIVNVGLGALGLFVPVVGAVGLIGLWFARGRDKPVGLVVEYLSEPPDELPPGLVGTLYNKHAENRDIIATLVDLARRGVLRFHELEVGRSRDFEYELVEREAALRSYERLLVRDLFQGLSNTVRLSDLKHRFYHRLPAIKDEMYKTVVAEGYFGENPKSTRLKYLLAGVCLIALAFVVGLIAYAALDADRYTDTGWLPVVGLGLIGLGLALLSGAMPRRTEKGATAAARWRAFRQYLSDIRKYENLEAATELFDKYLAYAICFGLDRRFVVDFSQVNTPAPVWYVPYQAYGTGYPDRRQSQGTFRPTVSPAGQSGGPAGGAPSLQQMSSSTFTSLQSMSTGLQSLLNTSTSNLTSSPPSSSSGGGGGGGGGGSGGGGGGAR